MADQGSKLPSELWAMVFEHIMPLPASVESDWSIGAPAQAAFWQLPMVCKAFYNTFADHPELGCCVFVSLIKHHGESRDTGTRSLVPWLQAQAEAVRALHAECTTSEVPKHLHLEPPPVSFALLQNKGFTADLHILKSFTSLTACCLSSSHALYERRGPVDLTPLQALRHLRTLGLHGGSYTCLAAVSFLTSLELKLAHTHETSRESAQPELLYCASASTLVQLSMTKSTIRQLHPRGLLGCTALQCLKIEGECHIPAEQAEDYFDIDECSCMPKAVPWAGQWYGPEDCSPLVNLAEVDLTTDGGWEDECMDLEAIGSLPNLQSLYVLSPQPYLESEHSFPHLSRLTKLCIYARTGFYPFIWNLDCAALKALQHLEIGGAFEAKCRVLGLLSLLHLHHVDLSTAEPVNEASQVLLKDLARLFEEDRPDVSFQPSMNSLCTTCAR